ncbi:MAG: hypothetical protein WDM78_22695 [Puia sp.]
MPNWFLCRARVTPVSLLSVVHQDLAGDTEIQFSENLSSDIDLLYLCVGHGEARKFLLDNPIDPGIRIIDLSQDFRIESNNRISASGKTIYLWFTGIKPGLPSGQLIMLPIRDVSQQPLNWDSYRWPNRDG